MALTVDRFVRIFTDDVSDDLLKNRVKKVNKAIGELGTATDKLSRAGIPAAGTFTKLKAEDETSRDKATQKATTKEKYEALDLVKARAREHAKSAEQALKIEPSQQDIDKLKQVLAQKDGAKKLDDLIAKMGEAKDDKSKKLVIAAMKARWDLPLISGDLDAKALPRIYQMMAMVPDDHIKGNTKLQEIRREKHPDPGETSFYRGSENLVVLNLDNTKGENECIDDSGNKREANYFDHTTLHEIGHAVDDKIKFMANKGKTSAYGGWRQESPESIAARAAVDKGLAADFPAYPVAMLAQYLTAVLNTGNVEPDKGAIGTMKRVKDEGLTKQELLDDPGLQAAEAARVEYERDGWPDSNAKAEKLTACQMAVKLRGLKRMATRPILAAIFDNRTTLDAAATAYMATLPDEVPTDEIWGRIKAHDAVKWCLGIRIKGTSDGVWDGGKSAADGAKLADNRVYQQSYKSDWWSYEIARPESISSYQFRAPAEWFAELYAAFHLGWLGKDHWMKDLDMSKEVA